MLTIKALLKSQSAFYDGPIEGIYVRIDEEDNMDNELAWIGFEDEKSSKHKTKGCGKGKHNIICVCVCVFVYLYLC